MHYPLSLDQMTIDYDRCRSYARGNIEGDRDEEILVAAGHRVNDSGRG